MIPRRVLILNDEPDALFLLRRALEREFPGVVVLEYLQPEVALSALASQPVDAVVTDNRMPQVSGIEFVRRVRQSHLTVPVIMLTGSEEKKAEAFAAGVTTFIASGSWTEIRAAIRRTLDTARPPGS